MKKQTSYVSDGGNHFDTEREALVDDIRHKITGGGTDNPAIAKAVTNTLALAADWFADTLGQIANIDKVMPPAVKSSEFSQQGIKTFEDIPRALQAAAVPPYGWALPGDKRLDDVSF